MEIILGVFIVGLALCLPVKCYNDGQFKMKCLDMHGSVQEEGANVSCTLPEGK